MSAELLPLRATISTISKRTTRPLRTTMARIFRSPERTSKPTSGVVWILSARGARGAEVNAAIHAAAAAGNPWARARLFAADWRNLPPADFDSELTSLLASREPEALGVVADVMARPHPDSRIGNVSGSDVDTWAWMLAACDLGKRCGANDALMRNLCPFGGLCGANVDFRQFLRESMKAPAGMDAIERQEQMILGP